jgi:hypothetical protein
MTRTTKDVYIKDVSLEIVKAIIVKWAKENKVKILINKPSYLYGRWGRGIVSASKFFEITLVPSEDGVLAKTEGWAMFIPSEWFYHPRAILPETEFSETGLVYAGAPRKEGMAAIKRLWATLEAASKA